MPHSLQQYISMAFRLVGKITPELLKGAFGYSG